MNKKTVGSEVKIKKTSNTTFLRLYDITAPMDTLKQIHYKKRYVLIYQAASKSLFEENSPF